MLVYYVNSSVQQSLVSDVYLSILDLVLERLLEKIEGVFLSVGLHHHVPGFLHLNLQGAKKKESGIQTHG